MESIKKRLEFIYGGILDKNEIDSTYNRIIQIISKNKDIVYHDKADWVDETDSMLITYGDSIKGDDKPLNVLHSFLKRNVKDLITSVHILPFYPYTSDDGFSVVDYLKVDDNLGNWNNINELSKDYKLMFDGVINHISRSSSWFQGYLNCDSKYKNYFITSNINEDYSNVTRPRALPLLTKFETKEGIKHVWTTFSEDQIDLNYDNVEVFLEILEILIEYIKKGAKYIRLDAIGFMFKEKGTTCIHLPRTHEAIKLYREILDEIAKGVVLITETNVPHKENIEYFGNGYDEASMVYQFAMPPLTLNTFIQKDVTDMLNWAKTLDDCTSATTYFNFLASHDGIGVRPLEGLVSEDKLDTIVNTVLNRGGKVSYKTNVDGSKSPYELNISYINALSDIGDSDDIKVKRFIAAQAILLSFVGIPGIYIHSLIGSENWSEGVEQSGINRRINREKLNINKLEEELNDENSVRFKVFSAYKKLLSIRKNIKAFSPISKQRVLEIDKRVFSIERINEEVEEKVLVLINISNEDIYVDVPYSGKNLITNKFESNKILLEQYEVKWILSSN